MEVKRSKVKICCNPYEKTIEYYRWDKENEEYLELSDRSELSKSEFTEGVTIQNKIQDILKILQRQYNTGNNGLDIEFEGTSDDFDDINDAMKVFCSGQDKYDMKVYKGNYELMNASKMKKTIEKEYAKLEKLFKDNDSDEQIGESIANYKNAVKPNIPICIMGLYSSGKSTFINSLIGQEILPSDSGVCTARIYKIISDNKAKISFTYKNDKIIFEFNDKKIKLCTNSNSPIVDDLKKVFDEETPTQERNMYRMLQVLNEEKYNRDIDNVIEVKVPFINTSLPINEYTFEIYDTPGSDSASHKEHLDILKSSLREQTNGLPIVITDCESLDKDGNQQLIDTINELGSALDKTNTVIVINKADEEIDDALGRKKYGSDIITRWQSNRIFFVSSILGLGSKKDRAENKNNWIDQRYWDTYRKNYGDFDKSNEDIYRQLYKYNIVSEDRKREYEKLVEGKDCMFINSGIHCVEHEIALFSKKYALYNKCNQAQRYISDAIELTGSKMKELQSKIDVDIEELKCEIDKKTNELITKLSELKSGFDSSAFNEFVKQLKAKLNIEQKSALKDLESDIKKFWESTKKENSTDSRVVKVKSLMMKKYEGAYCRIRSEIHRFSGKYWRENYKIYKESCMKAINENKELSSIQKKELQEYIDNILDVPKEYKLIDVNKKMTKGIWIFKTIDVKKCCEEYEKKLNESLVQINAKLQKDAEKVVNEWTKNANEKLILKLSEYNPELREKKGKVNAHITRRERMEKGREEMEESLQIIKNIKEYREVSRK